MSQDFFHQIIYLQNKRAENMDRYLSERRTVEEKYLQLYGVCDGVGSTKRGGEVAQEVVSALWDWFYALVSLENIREKLMAKIRTINETLLEKEESGGLPRGATTLSVLLLLEEELFVVHLGDSRIFGRKEEKWLQLTEDHSFQGAVTQVIPQRNISPHCLGLPLDFSHFMLATDGFYRKLDWSEVEIRLAFAHRNAQFLSDLVEQILEKGEKDNITAIFIVAKEKEDFF